MKEIIKRFLAPLIIYIYIYIYIYMLNILFLISNKDVYSQLTIKKFYGAWVITIGNSISYFLRSILNKKTSQI
jgi:hypothetical protein